MRTLNLLVLLWKSNHCNNVFQRLFATIFSCFFIFFVINFSEIASGKSADISGPVTGTLTVSLAGTVETGNVFDIFYLDDDNGDLIEALKVNCNIVETKEKPFFYVYNVDANNSYEIAKVKKIQEY